MILNVLDFASVEEALAEARDGDTVYFPAIHTYTPNSVDGWRITKSITLQGDGPGGTGTTSGSKGGTVLKQLNNDAPLLTIVPPARNVYIRDLQLLGTGGATGSGRAITCVATAGATSTDLGLERLLVTGFPGDGLRIEGFDTAALAIQRVVLRECTVELCRGHGVFLRNAFDVQIEGLTIRANQGHGASVEDGTVGLYQCTFDGNALGASGATDANLRLLNCRMGRVDSCRFVNFEAGPKRACLITGGVAIIGWCYFETASSPGTTGIEVSGAGTGPISILSQRFKNVATMISIGAGVCDSFVLPLFDDSAGTVNLPFPNEGMFGALHVARSTANRLSGLLIPSTNGDPAGVARPGMLAYNSSTSMRKLRFYVGGMWKTIETQAP